RASSPGSIGSGNRLYRPRRGTKRTRDLTRKPRPLLWEAIYVGPPQPSTGFLQYCCGRVAVSSEAAQPPRLILDGAFDGVFKGRKWMFFRYFPECGSRALNIGAHRL